MAHLPWKMKQEPVEMAVSPPLGGDELRCRLEDLVAELSVRGVQKTSASRTRNSGERIQGGSLQGETERRAKMAEAVIGRSATRAGDQCVISVDSEDGAAAEASRRVKQEAMSQWGGSGAEHRALSVHAEKIVQEEVTSSRLVHNTNWSVMAVTQRGSGSRDSDSEDDWPCLGSHAGREEEEEGCGGAAVQVDTEDEKAIEMFMNKNPPLRQTLADIIMEKITEKQTEVETMMSEVSGVPMPQLDPRVLEVYKGVKESCDKTFMNEWILSNCQIQNKTEHKRMEDEAVLDRGASFLKHVCDEEEVEGHHTIYIGVHVPKSYRRRRRHRRRVGHKDRGEREKVTENASDKSDVENDETSNSILRPLSIRWIKFEEKVEEGGERWSKPHVATLTLHSLFELRTCIEKGTIMLDLEAATLPQVVGSPTTTHRNLTSSSMNDISDKPEKDQLKNKFMKKLPRDAEASNVLVGEVDFLDNPFVAFVRLQQAVMLGALTEVPVPTRFLFILLGPKGKAKSYHEIGRAIATLMSDEVFHDIAYKAKDRQDLLAGIDEFLDEVIVLPPGEWDPAIRIEPPKSLPSSDKRKNMYAGGDNVQMNGDTPHDGGHGGGGHHVSDELKKTGNRWCPPAGRITCREYTLLLCRVTCCSPTCHYLLMLGVLESFLGTAVTGAVFCLFSGQPLIILSSTGPVLVFERLLFNFSKDNDFDYLEFRLWIGLWSALFCLLLVATDASFLVQYFTRFTEEGFSSLISFIFIYDAFKKMLKMADYYPINSDYKLDYVTLYGCTCMPPTPAFVVWEGETRHPFSGHYDVTEHLLNATWSSLSKKECIKYGGELIGKSCKYVPDIALMSFILFFGTYTVSMGLKKFKTSQFFPTTPTSPNRGWFVPPFGGNPWWVYLAAALPALLVTILIFMDQQITAVIVNRKEHKLKVRKLISDFAIVLSILIFCGVDALVGVDTPKLIVPSEFKPTSPNRGWFVPPFGGNPWWVYLAAALPALLVTILIFMDQQITAVIVNRKEHKLKKGAGYHLDLFWVAILIIVCSFMALPWYVAATVISIAHIDSLKMETETSAPGEQPKFLGVRPGMLEQQNSEPV
ncbi:UNVERIFIED_CONTAM: hypothetical protein FKN15_068166 [Acipenser sinensis]